MGLSGLSGLTLLMDQVVMASQKGPSLLMRSTVALLVLLSLSTLFGCSSISVSSDYDEAADFNSLRTFAWMQGIEEGKLDLGVSGQGQRADETDVDVPDPFAATFQRFP